MPEVSFSFTPVPCSVQMLCFDEARCIGCNRCVDVCQCDVLLPSPEKGAAPVVAYPGECCYCGACVMACPCQALALRHPLMNQAKFVNIIK